MGVNDDRPRLPSTTLRVVLNLGEKHAAAMPLPPGLARPEIDAEWDESASITAVSVNYPRGQLHFEVSNDTLDFHYHRANGEVTDVSPFGRQNAAAVLEWGTAFARDAHSLMPALEEDAAQAAAWHEAGYTLYVCETEPAQLDLLEVEIEGEILMLPWLGAGSVDQQHADGENHPIELLWTPSDGPERPIARAWLDPRTDQPKAAALPGIDWIAVGLPEPEALAWLNDMYLNHHVIEDPATAVFYAALERVAGLDRGR